MSRLAHPGVRRVQAALAEKGSRAEVIELETTARSAQDAARALGVALGAIVKSLLFTIDGAPVMALVAGDRRCDTHALPGAFGRTGLVLRVDAERVRAITGFVIGGVPPLGHSSPLPTAIDDSLGRFETIYAAAGHPIACSRPPCSSSACSPGARWSRACPALERRARAPHMAEAGRRRLTRVSRFSRRKRAAEGWPSG